MKARMILAVLITLTLITSSVAVGYAGGGAGSSIDATFFDCYVIHNGANSPYVLDLTDRFGVEKVRLGKARLLCTPTSAAQVERGPVLNGDFTTVSPDQIKCYDVLGLQPKAPGSGITIIDPLSTETVTLDQLSVVCSPAATNPPIPQ